MKKKFLLVLMLIVLTIVAFGAISASAETEGIYTYTVSNGEATITKCNSSASGEILIPDTLGGYSVTNIGSRAFSNCSNLTCITIPDSVTSIGNYAFSSCSSLTSITIPESVTSIADGAFWYCERLTNIAVDNNNEYYISIDGNLFDKDGKTLIKYAEGKTESTYIIPNTVTNIGLRAFSPCKNITNITIPDSVTSIGNFAFYHCKNLTRITISDGVTSIGICAFQDCQNLTNITIPDSITIIGDGAFWRCDRLVNIEVDNNNECYSSIDGNLFNKDITAIIKYAGGKTESTYIIPDSVTNIGDSAFEYCSNLTSITIPDSVTNIDYSAFSGCSNLTDVYYGGTETEWNAITIRSDNDVLAEAIIHYNPVAYLTYIVSGGKVEITDCDTSIVGDFIIPSTIDGCPVTSIGAYAFSECEGLTGIIIPDSVTEIKWYAFYGCTNLKSITLPFVGSSRTASGTYDAVLGYIFGSSTSSASGTTQQNFQSYDPNKSYYRYYYIPSSLREVIITDASQIPYGAFYNCNNLKSISISDSVQTISFASLHGCNALEKLSIPFVGNTRSTDIGYTAPFGIIFGSPAEYRGGVRQISNFAAWLDEYYDIPSSLKEVTITDDIQIPGGAFYNCSTITKISLPDSIQSIGLYAFAHCNIKEINIPTSIKTINNNAFYNSCDELTKVYIKNLATWCNIDFYNEGANPLYYGAELYVNDELVKVLVIPNEITRISSYAFCNYGSLESVYVSENISSMGKSAFSDCLNLAEVHITDLKKWCGISFSDEASNPLNCAKKLYLNDVLIKDLIFPNDIENIGKYTFYNCSSIESVSVHSGITSIGSSAFFGCENLEKVFVDDIVSWCAIVFSNDSANPLCYGAELYADKVPVEDLKLPNNITKVNKYAFCNYSKLNSLVIPSSVTHISDAAFIGCNNLSSVYYNGSKEMYDSIIIGTNNDVLNSITKKYFFYVYIIDENYTTTTKMADANAILDLNDLHRVGHTTKLYTDEEKKNAFDYSTNAINDNITFYIDYEINLYNHRFITDDGAVISKGTLPYDTVIIPPSTPIKENTQQYTYTFAGWEGYEEGITQKDEEMVFTAKYNATVNQYTYKFLDEDGIVLKEETADYGTLIITPEISDKTEYYLFDYWTGYTDGMTLTDDITFTAVYKYKNYSVVAEGLSNEITVTYNSEYMIDVQTKDLYHFIGYFTEKDGAGIQITNEKGESLNVYNVVGDLNVFPYFESVYMNKLEIQGVETAMPGDTITQKAIFATDKNATYFIATVKYPKYLNFKNIKGIDFEEANNDSEKVVGGYKYLDITCVFDYEGNFAEINTNYIPFEIEFDVNTDATLGACEISIENVMLIGDDTYKIADIKNHTITILPKLAESIEIIGKDEIDATEQFSAVVSPDYTTDKSVVWSVNDETVATITQDGTVTPVKNGTVVITATAKDGSEVFATKTVSVIAYAKISSLDFGSGVVLTEFNPDIRKYTVYVKENATSISLTPTFSGGGVLRPNGSGVWVSGRPKDFDLNDTATTITLNRENVTDMTNSVYTIEVIKFEGTKTEVSEDKKSFSITPINVENGKTVILALYNGDVFVEMQSAVYGGETIPFTTTKTYTKAKVMVWDDLINLKPIYDVEFVK